MKQNQASRTAEYMAPFSALENFRPPNVRLFEDRFALEFLTPSLRTVARMSHYPFFNVLKPWLIDRRWPGARSSGIARTRFIDDALRYMGRNSRHLQGYEFYRIARACVVHS